MRIISASVGLAGFLFGAQLGQADATDPFPIDRTYLRRSLAQTSGSLTLFGPGETASVKDYADAKTFCASKGQELASRSDYCSGTNNVPFGGVRSGQDQWAPIADGDNAWVQLGNTPHSPCILHGGPPAWGTDGVKNSFEANYVLCKQADKIMFGPSDTGSVKNHGEARAFCSSKGMTLASRSDYCTGLTPFGGVKAGQDQWSPFADYDNAWIQIGNSAHSSCAIHDPPPGWGTDDQKQPYEANYILCKTDKIMYGPSDTGSVKNYGEAKTFCSSKGKTLASRSDYCTGSTPFGGVKAGQDQWAPIADGDNAWVQLGNSPHSPCILHSGPPGWGTDDQKQPYEANYILCKARSGSANHLLEPIAPAAPTQVAFPQGQQPFQQCNQPFQQQGLFPPPIDGGFCLSLPGDIATLPLEILKYLISAVAGGDETIDDMVEQIFFPAEKLLELAFEKLIETGIEELAGFEASACVGNFDGEEITDGDDMVDICQDIPVATRNDARWSVFGSSITIPKPIGASICEGVGAATDLTISSCLVISQCELIPSIAFYMNSGILSCILGQAGVETSGVATGAAYAVEIGLDQYGFGFSLTNAFSVELGLYNGFEIFQYTASPTLFDTISFSLDSKKVSGTFEGWFVLRGIQTRGISINSPTGEPADRATTTAGLQSFDADAEQGDVTNQFDRWVVQLFMKGQVTLTMALSEIPIIGHFLEDRVIEFGQVSTFVSTGPQTLRFENGETKETYAGVSWFFGAKAENIAVNQIISFVFDSLNGILDFLPLPIPDIKFEQILNALDLDSIETQEYYGVGVTINEERMGFMINLPLLNLPLLGEIQFHLYTDYQKLEIDLKFQFHAQKHLEAVAKDIENGVLWLLNDGPQLIAAGFERAQNELQTDLYSEENIKKTVEGLLDGSISADDVDGLMEFARSAGRVLGLCAAPTCWGRGTVCLPGIVPGLGTCCNCCEMETYWHGKLLTACGTEPKWGPGTQCLAGTTCEAQCENGHYEYWFSKLFTACGTEPRWDDGTLCAAGTSCEQRCKNGYEWWFSKTGFHCGREARWGDGTVCVGGDINSCARCINPATNWPSDGLLKCGTEPCWKNVLCVAGVTCYNCCNGDYWNWNIAAGPIGQTCNP